MIELSEIRIELSEFLTELMELSAQNSKKGEE